MWHKKSVMVANNLSKLTFRISSQLLTYLMIFATTIIVFGLILYMSGCVIANVCYFGSCWVFWGANKINYWARFYAKFGLFWIA